MTPSVLEAHERSKRFHAHIAKKAAELAQLKVAIIKQPLVAVAAPIKPAKPSENAPLSWRILRAVADEFELTVSEMRCTSQNYRYVTPRHIAVGLMVEMTDLSWPKIGNFLGGRDHSTAFNSWRRYQVLAAEEAIRNRLDQMKAEILNG